MLSKAQSQQAQSPTLRTTKCITQKPRGTFLSDRSDLEAELGPGKVFVWWGCGQVSKYGQTQRPDNMQKVPS